MLRLVSWSNANAPKPTTAAFLPASTAGVVRVAADSYAFRGTEPTGGGKVGKPHVISMPSPNQSSRNGAKIDTIVLHHTAGGGTAQSVGSFFQNPSADVSSHYIIGKDGTIVQPVSDDRNAWHAGVSEFRGRSNVNNFSIGIEIVNHGNGSDPYPDAQYKALARLVAFLQSEYGIPWDRITGHKDVALPRGRKIDPSSNFSYDKLRQEVQAIMGGQQAPAPQPEPKPQPQPNPAPPPAPAPAPAPAASHAGPLPDSVSSHAGPLPGAASSHAGPLPGAAASPAGPIPGASYSSAAGPLPGVSTFAPAALPAAAPSAQTVLQSQLAAMQQMAGQMLAAMGRPQSA